MNLETRRADLFFFKRMKPASQYDQTITAAPGGWFCWLDFASNLSNIEEPKTDLKGKKRSKVREDKKKSGPINTESRTAQRISQTPTESNNIMLVTVY